MILYDSGFQLLFLIYEGGFSGFVQKRIKPISSWTVKTGKNQAEKNALEKTANLVTRCRGHELHLNLPRPLLRQNCPHSDRQHHSCCPHKQ